MCLNPVGVLVLNSIGVLVTGAFIEFYRCGCDPELASFGDWEVDITMATTLILSSLTWGLQSDNSTQNRTETVVMSNFREIIYLFI